MFGWFKGCIDETSDVSKVPDFNVIYSSPAHDNKHQRQLRVMTRIILSWITVLLILGSWPRNGIACLQMHTRQRELNLTSTYTLQEELPRTTLNKGQNQIYILKKIYSYQHKEFNNMAESAFAFPMDTEQGTRVRSASKGTNKNSLRPYAWHMRAKKAPTHPPTHLQNKWEN
jgi:hypothetical protein